MKLFKMKRNLNSNWEWVALFLSEKNRTTDLIEKFRKNEFLDIEQPISFLMVNKQTVKSQREEVPFKTDMIHFGNDVTYGAFSPYLSCHMIVSKKMKCILEGFILPPHKYYPITLTSNEDNVKNCGYELLQIINEKDKKTNYELTLYNYVDYSTDEVLKSERGGIKNAETFFARMNELLDNQNTDIEIEERVLSVEYDVMWGLPNVLIITERLKNAIKDAHLLGVECVLFKENYMTEGEYWARENNV